MIGEEKGEGKWRRRDEKWIPDREVVKLSNNYLLTC